MPLKVGDFLTDVWALNGAGKKVYPYKGERGDKKGLYSVNFTTDTKNYQGMSGADLIKAITTGKFRDRGTIRMLPVNVAPGAERNAFSPLYYQGKPIKDF